MNLRRRILHDRALIGALTRAVQNVASALNGEPVPVLCVVALLLVWAMRYPFRAALTVGIALAQIGEFSFILATLGRELGILTTGATNALVATSIVSIILNPVAYPSLRELAHALPQGRQWILPASVVDGRPRGSHHQASAASKRVMNLFKIWSSKFVVRHSIAMHRFDFD